MASRLSLFTIGQCRPGSLLCILSCTAILSGPVAGCTSDEAESGGDAALPADSNVAAATTDEQAEDRAGAFGGTLDGRLIYQRACASCHDEGFNGAPRLGVPSDWVKLDALGADGYTQITIAGIGIMPPRGGQPEMTDEQVRAAVEYILDEIG